METPQDALARHGERAEHTRVLRPAAAAGRCCTWGTRYYHLCQAQEELCFLCNVRPLGCCAFVDPQPGPSQLTSSSSTSCHAFFRSENERLYGWSGSKGGVSNEATAPKYRISSSGKLTLAPTSSTRENTPTSDRPALRTARSDGQVSSEC